MKNWLRILIIFILIIAYILVINIFASFISFSYEQQPQIEQTIIQGGSIVRLKVSDSVSVVVTKKRIYGRIIINDGQEYLYLFHLVGLPLHVKSYNFLWFHLIFLINLILFIFLIFIKRNVYKVEEPNLNYESLA